MKLRKNSGAKEKKEEERERNILTSKIMTTIRLVFMVSVMFDRNKDDKIMKSIEAERESKVN